MRNKERVATHSEPSKLLLDFFSLPLAFILFSNNKRMDKDEGGGVSNFCNHYESEGKTRAPLARWLINHPVSFCPHVHDSGEKQPVICSSTDITAVLISFYSLRQIENILFSFFIKKFLLMFCISCSFPPHQPKLLFTWMWTVRSPQLLVLTIFFCTGCKMKKRICSKF